MALHMHLPSSAAFTPLLAWLAIGAIIGLVGAWLAREPDGEGLLSHVAVGVVASLAAGAVLVPRLGLVVGRLPVYLLGALGVCLFGAVVAAGAVQLLRSLGPHHRTRRSS